MKMPEVIRKEVPILVTKTNTRVDIPKIFVKLLDIEKGDRFVWEYNQSTQELVGKLAGEQRNAADENQPV